MHVDAAGLELIEHLRQPLGTRRRQLRSAVAEFEAAIKVENERDVNSYKTAELYGMIAAVHVLRGDLSTADRFATLAISAHESAAAAHPGEREQLASQLRTLLMIEGEIKRRRGDTAGAEARERTAESIPAR